MRGTQQIRANAWEHTASVIARERVHAPLFSLVAADFAEQCFELIEFALLALGVRAQGRVLSFDGIKSCGGGVYVCAVGGWGSFGDIAGHAAVVGWKINASDLGVGYFNVVSRNADGTKKVDTVRALRNREEGMDRDREVECAGWEVGREPELFVGVGGEGR